MLNLKKTLSKIINALNEQPYQLRTVSLTQTISANSGATYDFSSQAPTIDGYNTIILARYVTKHGNSVYLAGQGGRLSTYIFNKSSAAMSTTVTAEILYLKTKVGG